MPEKGEEIEANAISVGIHNSLLMVLGVWMTVVLCILRESIQVFAVVA